MLETVRLALLASAFSIIPVHVRSTLCLFTHHSKLLPLLSGAFTPLCILFRFCFYFSSPLNWFPSHLSKFLPACLTD